VEFLLEMTLPKRSFCYANTLLLRAPESAMLTCANEDYLLGAMKMEVWFVNPIDPGDPTGLKEGLSI